MPEKYIYGKILKQLLCAAVLLLILNSIHAQNQNIPGQDTMTVQKMDSIPIFPGDTASNILTSLIPPRYPKDRTLIFLDSLKVKASKNLVTKTLFDFLVVTNEPVNNVQFTGTSDINFLIHTGKKIRRIEMKRLEPFGTNIEAPLYYDPNKPGRILNKTHINTSEYIVRKNLLFSEGDTVSALVLSDNERFLRQLSFINDARIVVVPVNQDEVDVVVITKDIYSLGADYKYRSINNGSFLLFEKNLLGMGHGLVLEIPYSLKSEKSFGLGLEYNMNNINKTFIDLNLNFYNTQLEKHYGISLTRKLVSATTKYAGGISISHMSTITDLTKSLLTPEPVKYNLQDYWLMRSFLIDKASVKRIIIGGRYKNNNVFDRPFIESYTYYNLQKYRIFLGSAAFSIQKYYKTNMIYNYGRTEDIPYGGLIRFTTGREINEFKKRTYLGLDLSLGESSRNLGYFYSSIGISSFLNSGKSEQGVLSLNMKYFSNLIMVRDYMIRNFLNVNYTRGFERYMDESITYQREGGFSGFRNDTVNGAQRITISLESVLFSPAYYYGFRFAFFVFADASFLEGTRRVIKDGSVLTGLGVGLRIHNNNLVVNTFQIRLGFFPNLPAYSRVSNVLFSGEQLLHPNTFDSGPPSIIQYR